MCGIFAAVNNTSVTEDLLQGLAALSYRGYDSAGIAVLDNGKLNRARSEGKLNQLKNRLETEPMSGVVGIAHTRWATHGLPNENNAHPHMTEKVAVVHNGVVENSHEIRDQLEQDGHHFESETDSECISQLITFYLNRGYTEEYAIKAALGMIEGSYSVAIILRSDHNALYAAKYSSPLIIGKSSDAFYISSDENALSELANEVLHLEDGELAKIDLLGVSLKTESGADIQRNFLDFKTAKKMVDKGNHCHYMIKEIHEQPEVFDRCWHHYYDSWNNVLLTPRLSTDINLIERITIVACGTSYFAGMIAKQWLETNCRIPVDVEIASEYRYNNSPVSKNSAVILISQSGETADTLASLRHAKSLNQPTIALVNVINSTMAREADIALPTLAGPEIGVASTKSLMSQLTTLLCLSLSLHKTRDGLSRDEEVEIIKSMRGFANLLRETINDIDQIKVIARQLSKVEHALFIGRGVAHALAEEGALKLKEVSYIHAEAHAAGELKHGPLALVDKKTVVVVIAPPDQLIEKTLSNLKEVSSRGGKVILLSSKKFIEENKEFIHKGIEMPEVNELLNPMLYAIPLQLLAYHTAVVLGNDVDQPRNLAKSVTVE